MNYIKRAKDLIETGKEYILDIPAVQEDFLQFVPATVRHIINSGDYSANVSDNDNESNCITVEKNIYTDEITLDGMDAKKYRPLFRGISDSLVKGDSVLVTQIGNIGYYLGPLNVSNTPSVTSGNNASRSKNKTSSKTYPYNIKFNRLIKDFNPDLDDPEESSKKLKSPSSGNEILADIHTDLVLEGRHGNSVRIGSRNRFPNVIIDNGRNTNQPFESINDSSIFAMFSQGSVLQHFRPEKENVDNGSYAFRLADESIDEPLQFIKSTFASPLGRGQTIDGESDSDIETTIYGYENGFSILNSDRIILNARKNDLYLSAFNHTHIGAGNTLTFSTSKNTLFNSNERFDINAPEVRLGSAVDTETEPILLGDTTVAKLKDLCAQLDKLISTITAITVPTTQGPSGTPINAASFTPIQSAIKGISDSLEETLSPSNRTT